ncbi:MAG: (d)CMP kinase [Aquihabitans sp.]
MLITISGLPGSGTSTAARIVASAFDLEHLDGGTVFRAMAQERGMSLADFALLAERDDTIDRALDERLSQRALSGDVLIESRLAGWLAARAGAVGLKIWVDCDEIERARRVGGRDAHDAEEAMATNRCREASERARYQAYYDIDLRDLSVYDLVVDSTTTNAESVAAHIVEQVKAKA